MAGNALPRSGNSHAQALRTAVISKASYRIQLAPGVYLAPGLRLRINPPRRVAAGNLFTSAVNFLMIGPDGVSRLHGAAYFWLFAGLMLATAGLFARVAKGLDDPCITRPSINRPG